MSPDDATLLQRWTAQRDAEAFNAIVDRFADQVYATCRRILRNDADAEDVSQECFLLLVRAGGDVRASLGGWLHRVATTRSLDRIRRDASRRAREQAYSEANDGAAEATDANGHFTVLDQAPADVVDISVTAGDGTWSVEQLPLEGNAITNLGAVTLE